VNGGTEKPAGAHPECISAPPERSQARKTRDCTQYGPEVHSDAGRRLSRRAGAPRPFSALRRIRVATAIGLLHDARHATRSRIPGLQPLNPKSPGRASNRSMSNDSTMETDMNRYDPRTPRALFAIAAVTLTVATLAISVLAPLGVERGPAQNDLATQVTSERCVPTDDTIVTGIDVVAVRAHHRSPIAAARDALVDFARS
jgi:hypothetical protein